VTCPENILDPDLSVGVFFYAFAPNLCDTVLWLLWCGFVVFAQKIYEYIENFCII